MRSRFLCECQCGGGARLDGKVKGSESPINIVNTKGPKTLTGLTQTGMWQVCSLNTRAARTPCQRWKGGPKPSVRTTRNTVNPYRRPSCSGRSTARKAVGGAGRGWRRKRTPACNGSDRSCVARQHHSTRKRADFRMVSRHEKVCSPPQEGKQMSVQQFGTGAPSSHALHLSQY